VCDLPFGKVEMDIVTMHMLLCKKKVHIL